MSTLANRKPLAPVNPAVELLAYCHATGLGIVTIDDTRYALQRLDDGAGRPVGMRLARPTEEKDGTPAVKLIDVDLGDPHGWRCDCEDATYRPDRPGGCKHCVALRKVAEQLRQC